MEEGWGKGGVEVAREASVALGWESGRPRFGRVGGGEWETGERSRRFLRRARSVVDSAGERDGVRVVSKEALGGEALASEREGRWEGTPRVGV